MKRMESNMQNEDVGELMMPPSPNWFCSRICESNSSGIIAFGAKYDIVLLNVYNQRVISILQGHQNRITALDFIDDDPSSASFLTDSSILVSGSADKSVIVWDIKKKKSKFQHKEHKVEVTSVSLSRNNTNIIVSGDKEGGIVVWSFLKNVLHSTKPFRSCITYLCFHPSRSDIIAIGYINGDLIVYNILIGKILYRSTVSNSEIQSIVFSPTVLNNKSHLLVYSCKNKSLGCISIESIGDNDIYNEIATWKFSRSSSSDSSNNKAFITLLWDKSDPNTIYSSTPNGEIYSWDVSSLIQDKPQFKGAKIFSGHSRSIFGLVAISSPSADSQGLTQMKYILSVSMDRSIVLWDKVKKYKVWTLSTLGGFVYSIDESPADPSLLSLSCGDNSIRLWNAQECLFEDNQQLKNASIRQNSAKSSLLSTSLIWKNLSSKVTCCKWHPTLTNILAFGTEDGRVGCFEIGENSQKLTQFQQQQKQPIYILQWGPSPSSDQSNDFDGNQQDFFLFSVSGEGNVLIFDLQNPKDLPVQFNTLIGLANGGDHILLQRISSSTGKSLNTFSKRASFDFDSIFSKILLGNSDGSIELYHYPTMKFLYATRKHKKLVNRIKWNKPKIEGKWTNWVSTCSEDGEIHIYDFDQVINDLELSSDLNMQSESYLKTILKGHQKSVIDVAWSSQDPHLLASASADTTIQIWNAQSGQAKYNIRNHHSKVISLCWSSICPRLIFSGSEDQSFHVNDLDKIEADPNTPTEPPAAHQRQDGHLKKNKSQQSSITQHPINNEAHEHITSSSVIANKNASSQVHQDDENAPQQAKVDKKSSSNKSSQSHQIQSFSKKISIPWSNVYSENDLCGISEHLQTFNQLNDVSSNEQTSNLQSSYPSSTMFLAPKMIESGLDHLTSNGDLMNQESSLLLEYWKGNVVQVIHSVIQSGQLNEMWVSLAASGGAELWKSACMIYAEQLEHKGDVHKASQYYLAIRNFDKAISVYENAFMFKEALSVASLRLSPDHPRIKSIYINWANHAVHNSKHLIAAKCYLAAQLFEPCVDQLRLVSSTEASQLSLKVASIHNRHEMTESSQVLLASTAQEHLTRNLVSLFQMMYHICQKDQSVPIDTDQIKSALSQIDYVVQELDQIDQQAASIVESQALLSIFLIAALLSELRHSETVSIPEESADQFSLDSICPSSLKNRMIGRALSIANGNHFDFGEEIELDPTSIFDDYVESLPQNESTTKLFGRLSALWPYLRFTASNESTNYFTSTFQDGRIFCNQHLPHHEKQLSNVLSFLNRIIIDASQQNYISAWNRLCNLAPVLMELKMELLLKKLLEILNPVEHLSHHQNIPKSISLPIRASFNLIKHYLSLIESTDLRNIENELLIQKIEQFVPSLLLIMSSFPSYSEISIKESIQLLKNQIQLEQSRIAVQQAKLAQQHQLNSKKRKRNQTSSLDELEIKEPKKMTKCESISEEEVIEVNQNEMETQVEVEITPGQEEGKLEDRLRLELADFEAEMCLLSETSSDIDKESLLSLQEIFHSISKRLLSQLPTERLVSVDQLMVLIRRNKCYSSNSNWFHFWRETENSLLKQYFS